MSTGLGLSNIQINNSLEIDIDDFNYRQDIIFKMTKNAFELKEFYMIKNINDCLKSLLNNYNSLNYFKNFCLETIYSYSYLNIFEKTISDTKITQETLSAVLELFVTIISSFSLIKNNYVTDNLIMDSQKFLENAVSNIWSILQHKLIGNLEVGQIILSPL